MKLDIDLFSGHDKNTRWDTYQKADLLNIIFQGGTFGNFLKHFLEKFSTKTPPVSFDPSSSIGTWNAKGTKYSGLIQRYHSHFINDNEGQIDLPVCMIVPSTKKHFLYLKKAQWFRSGDLKFEPDLLWKKAVGEMPEELKKSAYSIKELYGIEEKAHFSWIPKFIVRDWYKLEFLLNLDETYNYQWFEKLKNHTFFKQQNTYLLDLETFFNWDIFINNILELDRVFKLGLDFTKKEDMKILFEQGLLRDEIRQESNLAVDVIDGMKETSLTDLDVSTEGFIYAELEKSNDFIQMPLANQFFRDTEELRQFVEFYPHHYKAMNPNMPQFNGIPNPYYLKKD